jgi:hypothetical protein
VTRRLATQRLITTNDANGNPRRLVAVYDLDHGGDMIALRDEGYHGPRIAKDDMTTDEQAALVELPSWTIKPGVYRAALRDFRERTR